MMQNFRTRCGSIAQRFAVRNGADVPAGSLADGTTVMTYPRQVANFLAVRYILPFQ